MAKRSGRLKSYAVKEAYYTLQGEGAQTGRAAVFLRFAGCNLWSGLERVAVLMFSALGGNHFCSSTRP